MILKNYLTPLLIFFIDKTFGLERDSNYFYGIVVYRSRKCRYDQGKFINP